MKTANGPITVAGADAGDLSASFNSDPFRLEQMDLVAIQAAVSGSALLNGTLKLQVSCDVGLDSGTGPGGILNVTNWTDYAGSETTITADGTTLWNVSQCAFKWIRVVYTRTAGTGTLTIRANAKGAF